MSAGLVTIEDRPLALDQGRGSAGMALFVLSEAALFACLFFAYFYLARDARGDWPPQPPKLHLALPMLAVLVTSSVVLELGERAVRRREETVARWALAGTIALGGGFLVLQGFEYRERLRTLRPSTDAYGSIFYTITSLHGAHVLLGLGMLTFVALLPRLGPTLRSPHRPLRNAALYWHFVDAVWVVIVALLYVLPAVRG